MSEGKQEDSGIEISPNFSFLKVKELAELATLAEKYYQSDPNTALIKCRQFIEFCAKDICTKNDIDEEIKDQNLFNIIEILQNKDITERKIYGRFHQVRKLANSEVHINPEDSQDIIHKKQDKALKCILKVHEIAIWFHEKYYVDTKAPSTKIPEYKVLSHQNGEKPLPQRLANGFIVRQRYQIKEELGRGSFGTTYLAQDLGKPTKPLCVVKQFTPRKSDKGTFSKAVQLFQREAEVLEKLGTQSEIPTMIEYFEENENLLLVQEYIAGNTLREELRKENRPYQEHEVIQLLKDILTPLCNVHNSNIVHRDLKPENLIRRASDRKIVIIDFGAVKEIFEDTQQGTIIGTVGYIPPEQGRSSQLSFRFDIYAVGMIALEAITGELATDIASPKNTIKQIEGISDQFRKILSKMTALDYDDRYADAQEILDTLAELPPQSLKSDSQPIITEEIEMTTEGEGAGMTDETKQGTQATETKKDDKSLPLWQIIATGIGLLVVLGVLIRSIPYFNKTKLAQTEITIGTIWEVEQVEILADYIEDNSVPANYLSFFMGDKVKIRVNGDKTLSYPEAKKRMESKQWDVAFATSPILSIFAQDQGYNHVAKMFPGADVYNAGLFVRRDSPIQSIDDINRNTKVGLGSFDSASSFYMPVYDLYGKAITVNTDNKGSKIIDMLKDGTIDVGSAAINDKRSNDSDIRIIQVSRDIPTSGVYASPNLSSADQANLKALMINAPETLKKEANYEEAEPPDYTEFRKIMDRVEEILVCVDFNSNPVFLACRSEIQTIEGSINGVSVQGNNSVLTLSGNGQIYKLALPLTLTQEIFGSDNLVEIQGKKVQVRTDQPGLNISISQINQIKLL